MNTLHHVAAIQRASSDKMQIGAIPDTPLLAGIAGFLVVPALASLGAGYLTQSEAVNISAQNALLGANVVGTGLSYWASKKLEGESSQAFARGAFWGELLTVGALAYLRVTRKGGE